MIRNFFTTTIRSFLRNWTYTLINILGLGVGIGVCITIFIIIQFEINFDTFHSRYDRINRVVYDSENASGVDHSAATPYPFIGAFRADFADIPLSTQFHFQNNSQLTYGAEKMKLENILFADSLFFEVFDFGVISGNPRVDLGQPGKAFLTESLAKKINKDGQLKTIRLDNKLTFEIVGIVKDPPAASHLTYTLIVSMPSFSSDFAGLPIDQWGMTMAGYSYVVLPDNMKATQLRDRLDAFVSKYFAKDKSGKRTFALQPLADIHFSDVYQNNAADKPGMSKTNLVVLTLLGLFILAVACVNFINLSTALATRKSREIGVRKTLGANRSQLTLQFLSEALLLTLLSTLTAMGLVELSIQPIGAFLEKELLFDLTGSPIMPLFLILLVLITALLSGLYPAFVLSRFNPAVVLKSKLFSHGSSPGYARQYLVMFQFLIAQVLIIGTLVVGDQMNYFQSKSLGFRRDAIVNVAMPENKKEQLDAFQTQLAVAPGVENVSFSLGAPTSENNFTTGFFLSEKGDAERFETRIKPIDRNYLSVYGIDLIAGRWFTESDTKQSEQAVPKEQRIYYYVVNEALVRRLGFHSAEELVGKNITTGLNDIQATVIGVVKDFHSNSLHTAVEPTVMIAFPYFYYDAGIQIDGKQTRDALAAIEKAYAKVFPEYIIEYTFLDQHLASLYREEERAFGLIRVLTGLSLFISCLGLLGLISFVAQQKIKEVGIRKVFGASVADIVLLFSRSFVGVIFKASLVAAPLSWYVMDRWLNTYAYRTSIGADVFFIAIGSTVVIALATVSHQSIRSAMANPVNSLRNE